MATILIVDDIASNRAALGLILSNRDHRIIEAGDGAAALAVARAEVPDLVITDVLMPVMDGYELVARLREEAATAAIPILFYTAHYGEAEARELALSMGVAEVLTKPIDSRAALGIIDSVLAGRAMEKPASPPITAGQYRDHLRIITDKLSVTSDDLRAANMKLRALVNIGLELATLRNSEELLQAVCTSAGDLFGAKYATIGMLDADHRGLARIMICGADPSCWTETTNSSPGLLGTVTRECRIVRGLNPGGDPRPLGLPASHPPVPSFLAAPIKSPSQVYGWVCLVGENDASFSTLDESLALALFSQVGRAYENGTFYATSLRRAAALEREVTERKQAQRVAKAERAKAQSYLDQADIMLVALDTERRITLVNRKACRLLGWTEAELIGRDWADTCLPPRIRESVGAKFGQALDGGLSSTENPVLTRGGDERMIEWRNTLLRGPDGRVVGIFSSGADITEQSEAIRSLRITEERMRFALESADVGVWDMDYVTGRLAWSDTMHKHYGVSAGTFAGTFDAFIDCVYPEDRESVLETIGTAMRLGSDFQVQNRASRPDGTVRYLRGAGRVVLGPDGAPVRAIGISLDVTDARLREEQFRQAQKMEAVGRLAGGVAHDFNNLLTIILGYCELHLAGSGVDDASRRDINEIQKAGQSAAALTRQLLAFSRKQIIEPTIVNVNEVIEHVRPLITRLIGADVDVVVAPGQDVQRIRMDRGQLEQILMNLAVNARDAMPKGGTLRIETADVELDQAYADAHLGVAAGAYVRLTVADTGTGIAPDVQARMFEPFFTTKGPGKGTGLGLSTVHGIVTGSGGIIEVNSEAGIGTVMRLYFPRTDEVEASGAPAIASLFAPRSARTVLLVEDAAGVRELTGRLLEQLGYRVLTAANAEEAMELFDHHDSIDVLLTDVIMPGASGPDLGDRLMASRPGLKVIYMSGYTEETIVHRGVLKPGVTFLHKPFSLATLGQKVRDRIDAIA